MIRVGNTISLEIIRGQNASGVWQRFEYDAAGRLVKVKDDSNNVLETYTYAASRERLIAETSTQRRYFAGGGNPLIEYTEATASSTPVYAKSYVYAGSRLLSTATNNSGTETVEFHHPDRLGTKLITNAGTGGQSQQSTLPFGTELSAENSGSGSTNQKFTSYDRSAGTGLDYAVNRTYSSGQGRFTQVDPIGMAASTPDDPQSMNMYAYVRNIPTDLIDPSGLTDDAPQGICMSVGGTLIGCVVTVTPGEDEPVSPGNAGVTGTMGSDTTGMLTEQPSPGTTTDTGGQPGTEPPPAEPPTEPPTGPVPPVAPPTQPPINYREAKTTQDCQKEYEKTVWRITRQNFIRQGAIVIGILAVTIITKGVGAIPALAMGTATSGGLSVAAIAELFDAEADRKKCLKEVEKL